MSSQPNIERATKETAENLKSVTRDLAQKRLTKLTLPELDAVVKIISNIVPAGNVPGLMLSGLSRVKGNRIKPEKARPTIFLYSTGPFTRIHTSHPKNFNTSWQSWKKNTPNMPNL